MIFISLSKFEKKKNNLKQQLLTLFENNLLLNNI